jgi:hypothetical protein
MFATIINAKEVRVGDKFSVSVSDSRGSQWIHSDSFDRGTANKLLSNIRKAGKINQIYWKPIDPVKGSEADVTRGE